MADLLVPLYRLPDTVSPLGYTIRRPMASEGTRIQSWIEANFSRGWASEILPGLARTPATILAAVDNQTLSVSGFCAWDCTALGFLGPVGVAEESRNIGLGRSLVLQALLAMREQGYGYAVVGDAGPSDFFAKACGATEIPNSSPGIYRERIR